MDQTNPGEDFLVKPSKKRWLVLLLSVILMTISVYMALCFGPINNIMVAYFNISYATSDWITLSTYFLSIVGFMLCAWLGFVDMLNLKFILLLASGSLLIDAIFILIAFSNIKLFFLMVIGQLVGGVARTATGTLFFIVGPIWFPENEIAFAAGCVYMSWSVGMALSEILPETILKVPIYSNSSENYTNHLSNGTAEWFSTDQHRMEIMFLIIVGVLILTLICIVSFIPRLPEYPPSYSQAVKQSTSFNSSYSLKSFYKEIKELHQDLTYILIQLANVLGVEEYLMLTVIMQQVVDDILPQSNVDLNSSVASGLALMCSSLGIAFLSPVSGKILDRYKQYRLLIVTGILLSFLCSLGVFLSWFYSNFIAQCVCMFLCGCSLGAYGSAIYDALAQHIYPKNILLVSSCTIVFQYTVGILMAEIARLIFLKTEALGVMIFYVVLKFLAVVVSFFMKPNLKRLQQEKNASDARNVDNNISLMTERTPILGD